MAMYDCRSRCLCARCKRIFVNCAECKKSVEKTKECLNTGIKQCKDFIERSNDNPELLEKGE